MSYVTLGIACAIMLCAMRLIKMALRGSSKYDSEIPVVGIRPEFMSMVRGAIRQVSGGMATMMEGYHTYSRHGKPFFMHESSLHQELLLPPEHIRWFGEQPEATISHSEVHLERHAIRYLHAGVHYASTSTFVEKVVRDNLGKNLDIVQAPMLSEVRTSLDGVLGVNSTDWTTLNIYEAMQEAVYPVMSRIFFGEALTRDPDMRHAFRRYCTAMGLGILVVGQLPRFLKSTFAPLFNLPLWWYRRQSLRTLQPIVQKQLQMVSEEKNDTYDFFQLCAKTSARLFSAGRDSAADSNTLAEWIMLVCFTGLLSQVVQTTNLVLDIAHACRRDRGLYDALRHEVTTVLQDESDWRSVASFKKLRLLDSTIRESLRCHPILVKGLTKEVVNADGLRLPDGTLVPRGTWLGVPVLGVHMDERFYANPQTFNPYRFVQSDTEISKRTVEGRINMEAARPSETYFGFGYGRHACPGRWLAVLMLKTMLAYILLNYEFEPVGEQPALAAIGDAALPPVKAEIRVRRIVA